MAEPSRNAGGFLITIGCLAGVVGGFLAGEVTRGFLIGLATGAALAIAVWLRGR